MYIPHSITMNCESERSDNLHIGEFPQILNE